LFHFTKRCVSIIFLKSFKTDKLKTGVTDTTTATASSSATTTAATTSAVASGRRKRQLE
jgi:hypothetical protein